MLRMYESGGPEKPLYRPMYLLIKITVRPDAKPEHCWTRTQLDDRFYAVVSHSACVEHIVTSITFGHNSLFN